MSKEFLCQRTIHTIESVCGESIPQELLNAANGIAAENQRRSATLATKWGELDSTTTLLVADQMYRYRACVQTLATILTDKGENYGLQLSRVMIASSMKQKRRHAGESIEGKNSRERKSRVMSPVRLYRELDTINANAADILFGAVDRIRILIPDSIGKTWRATNNTKNRTSGLLTDVGRVWWDFTGTDLISLQSVRMAASMDERELHILRQVVEHNISTNEPSKWQPVMFTTHQNDAVSELIGDEVLTIRRVFRSLAMGITNVVLSAYAASVYRFLVLEFGNNTEYRKELDLSSWETDPGFESLMDADSARAFANTLTDENERKVFWLIQNENGAERIDSFYEAHSGFLRIGKTKFYETLGSLTQKAKKFGK